MKRKLLFYLFYALIVGGVFWACRKDWRQDAGRPDDVLTVEQARAFFENTVAPTKTGGYLSSVRSMGADLNPGDLTPLWDRAHRAVLNGFVDGVDVEIDADYRYAAVFSETTAEGDTVRRTVELAQKLVVNRWRNHPRWLGLYAYIATIVPAPDYYDRHKDFGRRFVNLGDKGDFSGFVIYHTLNGEFVNADRYDGGRMTAQVYDTGGEASDRYAAAQMLGGVELYGSGASTYALNMEIPGPTVQCCRSCGMMYCYCQDNLGNGGRCTCNDEDKKDPSVLPTDTTTNKPNRPAGGGTTPDEDKDKKPQIRKSDRDCDNNYSQNLSSARSILNRATSAKTQNGESGQWSQFLRESDGKGVEYGMSMFRISNGTNAIYGFMPMQTGTANDVHIEHTRIENSYTHTVASFHTHTNGLPPSGQDVAELCNIDKPELKNDYVITGSGSSRTVYTLHVENPDALVSSRRSIQVDPATNHFTPDSEAGHHYNEAMARFEGSDYSAEERHAYSLAYALEKCNTGIRLLKGSLTSNGVNVAFEQIQMDLQTDATNLKNCK